MQMRALTVDLDAIRHNADVVRSRLQDGVKMLCVVKADAYGHNAEMVARALRKQADAFAVAVAEEGLQLRQAGIRQMILVLGRTSPAEWVSAVQAGLSLAVFEPSDIIGLEKIGQLLNKTIRVHLKLDTGMSRLGVRTEAELEEMLRILKDEGEDAAFRYVRRRLREEKW